MATKIWKTPVAGNWSDVNNWLPWEAPVTNDVIQIGAITKSAPSRSLKMRHRRVTSLKMFGNHKANQSSTLSVTPSAVLTVNGPITFDANSFINGVRHPGCERRDHPSAPAITGGGTIIASNGGTLGHYRHRLDRQWRGPRLR